MCAQCGPYIKYTILAYKIQIQNDLKRRHFAGAQVKGLRRQS